MKVCTISRLSIPVQHIIVVAAEHSFNLDERWTSFAFLTPCSCTFNQYAKHFSEMSISSSLYSPKCFSCGLLGVSGGLARQASYRRPPGRVATGHVEQDRCRSYDPSMF